MQVYIISVRIYNGHCNASYFWCYIIAVGSVILCPNVCITTSNVTTLECADVKGNKNLCLARACGFLDLI